MLKAFLILTAFIFVASCNDQTEIILSEHPNGATHEKIVLDNKLIIGDTSGVYKEFFGNGILAAQGRIEHNKQQGTWVKFHPNGTVSQSAQFKDGKLNGEFFWCDQYGNWIKKNFKDGQKNGKYIRFEKWPSEQRDTLYFYTVGQFQNNLAEGLWQRTDTIGTVIAENTLLHGKITGYFTNRYKNGAIKLKGELNIDSTGSNKFDYYDENGKKLKLNSYQISLVEP